MASQEVLNQPNEVMLLKLAREIAMDIHDIDSILQRNSIDPETWDRVNALPSFQRILKSEVASWETATNTHERVKIKAAAMFEEWMPTLYARLSDPRETLSSQIEGGKLITRVAGMGLDRAVVDSGGGEKISIQINLGADAQLNFEKQLPGKVIDVEPNG